MRTRVVSFSNHSRLVFVFSSERPNSQLGTKTKDCTINGHGKVKCLKVKVLRFRTNLKVVPRVCI